MDKKQPNKTTNPAHKKADQKQERSPAPAGKTAQKKS